VYVVNEVKYMPIRMFRCGCGRMIEIETTVSVWNGEKKKVNDDIRRIIIKKREE
jgi:hypothetical protein